MSALSQTLAALDEIPTLVESIRNRAETTATKARVALESMAVAMEDSNDAPFTEPKELTDLKELDITPSEIACLKAEIERLKKSDELVKHLIETGDLDSVFLGKLIKQEFSYLDRVLIPFVDLSKQENWAFRAACRIGNLEDVSYLLKDPRVDPSAVDNYALCYASHYGHVAVVDRLLQDPRIDPTDVDNTAIRNASACGHIEVVARLLQDPRVDPTALDNDAIRIAHQHGHVAVVELLKAHGCVLPQAPVAP